MTNAHPRSIGYGGWLMTAAAIVGLLLALYYYLDPATGVAYTDGTVLVLVSTALLTAAALVLMLDHDKPTWLIGLLYVLTFLDIIGTGFAAYMLDAYWLLGAMVVALIGWFIRVIIDPSDEEIAANAIRREVLS